MASYTIGVIAGDGIGKEVIPAGIAAIEKATRGSERVGVVQRAAVGLRVLPQHQRMMDEDGYERMAKFDAIYMGALGAPGVSDAASAGTDPRHPAEVRSVRQPAADAAARRA